MILFLFISLLGVAGICVNMYIAFHILVSSWHRTVFDLGKDIYKQHISKGFFSFFGLGGIISSPSRGGTRGGTSFHGGGGDLSIQVLSPLQSKDELCCFDQFLGFVDSSKYRAFLKKV